MLYPKLSVCVSIYNNANNFKNLFYSITSDFYNYAENIEFIVYNDGSTVEGIHEEVEKFCDSKGIKYIHNAANRGVAHAWNRLTEAASSEIVVLLNDDTRLCTKNWIDHIRFAFEKNEQVGIIYWCQRRIDSNTGVFKGYTKDSLNLLSRMNYYPYMRHCFSGAFFAFRKEVWAKVIQPDNSVGFWEDLLSYGEEVDLSSEFLNRGYSIIQLPTITFEHFSSQTFQTNPEKKLRKILSDYLPLENFHKILLKFPHHFKLSDRELFLLKMSTRWKHTSIFRNIFKIKDCKIYNISRLDYSRAMLLKKWGNRHILGFDGSEYLDKMYSTGYPSALKIALKNNKFSPPEKIYILDDKMIESILEFEDCINHSSESLR